MYYTTKISKFRHLAKRKAPWSDSRGSDRFRSQYRRLRLTATGRRSRSRNPRIFRMFTRMHLVESVGTGIPRIARILSEDGFPPAEYKTEGFFTTILRKKKASSTEQAGESKEKNQEKSKEKTEEKVLRLITANPRITTAELAAECSLNENTIYKTVRKLRESGRIQRKGGDKGGEWIVLKP